MAKRIESQILYQCESCGKLYDTEEEANRCAVKDKLIKELYAVDENPDFEESPEDSDEDIDADDSEVHVEPGHATSIAQVESVSISTHILGWRTTVYVRKKSGSDS